MAHKDMGTSTPEEKVTRLIFGVNSKFSADVILQNNLTLFEWVTRNKQYPSFWGRNIAGDNSLTKEEIAFLHGKGCKISLIYPACDETSTQEKGEVVARKITSIAFELGVPGNTAVFLEIPEESNATTDFLRGYAKGMIFDGYVPGFKANTDAIYGFDREFSRGMRIDRELFSKCLVWAVAPSLEEYDRITTTHLIHPDNWVPYVPSGITRKDIALWQYGKECHPICDDNDNMTFFNISLMRSKKIIIENML